MDEGMPVAGSPAQSWARNPLCPIMYGEDMSGCMVVRREAACVFEPVWEVGLGVTPEPSHGSSLWV